MANDPGRQILEDQIQSGFLFLEDYLDNILVGPRHECVPLLLYTLSGLISPLQPID